MLSIPLNPISIFKYLLNLKKNYPKGYNEFLKYAELYDLLCKEDNLERKDYPDPQYLLRKDINYTKLRLKPLIEEQSDPDYISLLLCMFFQEYKLMYPHAWQAILALCEKENLFEIKSKENYALSSYKKVENFVGKLMYLKMDYPSFFCKAIKILQIKDVLEARRFEISVKRDALEKKMYYHNLNYDSMVKEILNFVEEIKSKPQLFIHLRKVIEACPLFEIEFCGLDYYNILSRIEYYNNLTKSTADDMVQDGIYLFLNNATIYEGDRDLGIPLCLASIRRLNPLLFNEFLHFGGVLDLFTIEEENTNIELTIGKFIHLLDNEINSDVELYLWLMIKLKKKNLKKYNELLIYLDESKTIKLIKRRDSKDSLYTMINDIFLLLKNF
jgi:hypothetical protein